MSSVNVLARAALAGLALASPAAWADAPRYRVEFAEAGFQGRDLNNLGEVVGISPTGRFTYDSFVYGGGIFQKIELEGVGGSTVGFGPRYINDRGQIAGMSTDGGGDGILYDKNNGRITNMTRGWGDSPLSVWVDGMNNNGKVVGSVITLESDDRLWQYDGRTASASPLEHALAGRIKDDHDIEQFDLNDRDVLLGRYYDFDGRSHAFTFADGTVTELSTANGFQVGTALNDAGQIAGYGLNAMGERVPYLYDHGVAVNLGTLGGVHPFEGGGEATAINAQGWVVGRSFTSASDAAGFLYRDGEMFNLNDLVKARAGAQWDIDTALKVNDLGQILAYGTSGNDGTFTTFLLSPVPEAQTWALMLAGLGVLGTVARRRRDGRR